MLSRMRVIGYYSQILHNGHGTTFYFKAEGEFVMAHKNDRCHSFSPQVRVTRGREYDHFNIFYPIH